MDVDRTPINYWVAEQWDGETLNARWTSEKPGRTGPADLVDRLDQLRADGWRVYEVSMSGDPWPQLRREALLDLARLAVLAIFAIQLVATVVYFLVEAC